jgi:hypothetical protein
MSIGASFGNRDSDRDDPSCPEEGVVRHWSARRSCSLRNGNVRLNALVELAQESTEEHHDAFARVEPHIDTHRYINASSVESSGSGRFMTDSLSCHPRMCMLCERRTAMKSSSRAELIVPLGAQRAVVEGGKWKRSESGSTRRSYATPLRTVCRECTELKRRIRKPREQNSPVPDS